MANQRAGDQAFSISSNDFAEPAPLSPQDEQREQWKRELAELEEEIPTLRSVLANKSQRVAELKRLLGVTLWQDLSEDLKTIKDSSVVKKTSSLFGGLTETVSTKLGEMRHSESFRSFEEKIGSAYENVKTKVSTSRSGSVTSLDDALNQHRGARTPNATSPTIPEDRPIA